MHVQRLLAMAAAARTRAYAPYSRFAVGAALATGEKMVFTGCNLENGSFGLTVCAERVALWSAWQSGYRRFTRLAVVADCSPPPTPCGACRQVIFELAGDIELIMGNLQGEVVQRAWATCCRSRLPLISRCCLQRLFSRSGGGFMAASADAAANCRVRSSFHERRRCLKIIKHLFRDSSEPHSKRGSIVSKRSPDNCYRLSAPRGRFYLER